MLPRLHTHRPTQPHPTGSKSSTPTAPPPAPPLPRPPSLDSAFSVASASTIASGPTLSGSWGGLGPTPPSPKAAHLSRQVSLPVPTSAPVDIPGNNPLRRASLDYGLLRRNSISFPLTPRAGGPGSVPAPGGAAAAAAEARARLPLLVRSLSKGLSESMDFR
jgi:hypothetical protein